MLTKESRKNLAWALKASLLEKANKIPDKSARSFVREFIVKEATYEQLLNLALNPYRDERYLSEDKLERVALAVVKEQTSKEKSADALLESFVKESGGWPDAENIKGEPGSGNLPSKLGYVGGTSSEDMMDRSGDVDPNIVKSKVQQFATPIRVKAGALAKGAGAALKDPANRKYIYGGAGVGVAALGIAGYLIYRKMRAAGKSREEAAAAAAQAEKDPEKKARWEKKAAEAQG